MTLVAVVRGLAEVDPSLAMEVARSITDLWGRARALADIVAVIAADHSAEALDLTLAIPEEAQGARASALASIAFALAQRDPDQAVKIARSIGVGGDRARALAEIARVHQRPEIADEALDVVRSVTNPVLRGQALVDVATVMAAADGDQALHLARSIADDAWRVRALAEVARVQRRPDIADEALDVARSITTPPWGQAQALADITPVIAVHDPDRALELAGLVNDNGIALGGVAIEIAGKDPDRAFELALQVRHNAMRDKVMAHVAGAIAQRDLDRALMIARSIGVEAWRVQALVSVAQRLGSESLVFFTRSSIDTGQIDGLGARLVD